MLAGGAAAAAVGVAGAAGAFVLVENRTLPGKLRLDTALGKCGQPLPLPVVQTGPVVTGTFASAARGRDVSWQLAYPPGFNLGAALPVCIALHGGSADAAWLFTGDMSLQYFLADAVTHRGSPPFVIAAADGGDAVNWHTRADGDDPQKMITGELLPKLADMGLRTQQIGLWGISLGGYGALLLGSELGPQRTAAVAVSSPALWREYSEAQPGRFDSQADFDEHSLFSRTGAFDGIPLRIDCGSSDPFAPAVEQFRRQLPVEPAGEIADGCHDTGFWTRQATAQLQFIGEYLR